MQHVILFDLFKLNLVRLWGGLSGSWLSGIHSRSVAGLLRLTPAQVTRSVSVCSYKSRDIEYITARINKLVMFTVKETVVAGVVAVVVAQAVGSIATVIAAVSIVVIAVTIVIVAVSIVVSASVAAVVVAAASVTIAAVSPIVVAGTAVVVVGPVRAGIVTC